MTLKVSTTQVVKSHLRSFLQQVCHRVMRDLSWLFLSPSVTFPLDRHLSLVVTFYVKGAPQFHSFRAHFRLKQTSKFMLFLPHGAGE